MTSDDDEAFRACVDVLAVGFRCEMSPALYQALWEGLSDLPIEDIQRAVNAALRRCEFMPTVAELAELAGYGRDARPYFRRYEDSSPPPRDRRIPAGGYREYARALSRKASP